MTEMAKTGNKNQNEGKKDALLLWYVQSPSGQAPQVSGVRLHHLVGNNKFHGGRNS